LIFLPHLSSLLWQKNKKEKEREREREKEREKEKKRKKGKRKKRKFCSFASLLFVDFDQKNVILATLLIVLVPFLQD